MACSSAAKRSAGTRMASTTGIWSTSRAPEERRGRLLYGRTLGGLLPEWLEPLLLLAFREDNGDAEGTRGRLWSL
jgi:hypothetical protein